MMTSWPGPKDFRRQTMGRFRGLLPTGQWNNPRLWLRQTPPVAIVTALLLIGALEVRGSWFQAMAFSGWADAMTFAVADGPSQAIHFPDYGPFDQQRGDRKTAE